jgi:3-hydroxybutyryl-CoA dehydratase
MSRQKIERGDTFEGPSKTLNDAHFLFFSGLTGDAHPIHYDVEYAKATRFGKPLAHGLLLASMTALGASTARERLEGFIFVEQGCTFLKPAVIGDTIRPRFVAEKIWRKNGRLHYRFATALLNQRDEVLLKGFHVYWVFEPKKGGK